MTEIPKAAVEMISKQLYKQTCSNDTGEPISNGNLELSDDELNREHWI